MEFHGFDTETQGGRAVLLSTENDTCDFPRTIERCYDWLLTQGRKFVAWNADYDARALLALAPRSCYRRLHYLGGVTLRSGLRISYLKSKRFTLARGKKAITIYDAQQFYGGALDATSRRVLGGDGGKAPLPRAWITRMGDVLQGGGEPASRVRAYAVRDARLALELYRHVRAQYNAIGVGEAEPLSPAYLAGRHFKAALDFKVRASVNAVFRRTFFGARIELWQQGRVGPWRGHDIRSAYPAALAVAPDPKGAHFTDRDGANLEPDPDAIYGAYECDVAVPSDCSVPPFPVRTARGLIYPVGRWRAWLDRETLFAHRDKVVRIIRAAELHPVVHRPLLPEMVDLFREKERRHDVRQAIKLLTNSTYGKTAQAIQVYQRAQELHDRTVWIDDEPYEPTERLARSTHFAVAAFVTARCRLAVQAAMALAPRRVVAVCTDAVYFSGTRRIPRLVTGDGLGDWDDGEAGSDSVWVQPGVYGIKRAGRWTDRTRGFRALGTLIHALDTRRRVTSLRVSASQTLGQAVRSHDPELFNLIRRVRKRLDPNADWKRAWPGEWRQARQLLTARIRSRPLVLDA